LTAIYSKCIIISIYVKYDLFFIEKRYLNMRVFFIGGGNIARIVADELGGLVTRSWYYDIKETGFSGEYIGNTFYIPKEADFVVECASVGAVKEYGEQVIKSGKDFYIISSGAFADTSFFENFLDLLKDSQSSVFVPSGAIGGIDIINAVKPFVDYVELNTRKPAKAFNMEGLVKTEVVFSGNAKEAISKFPQNANVSVTLSLAVGSFDKVKVNFLADPSIDENIHEVNIYSSVGNYSVIHKNKPSPNPKTSYLAPLSLVSAIKKRTSKFQIG